MKKWSFSIDRRQWRFHVIAWMIFIFYEIGYLKFLIRDLDPWYTYLAYYVLNIAVFYLQLELLKTFFEQKQQIVKGLVLFMILIIGAALSKQLLSHLFFHRPLTNDKAGFYGGLYRAGQFVIYATLYWGAGRLSNIRYSLNLAIQQQELLELNHQRQMQETEIAYLRQRLNPHLLFNTLNLMYAQVFQHSREAAKDVTLLSDIMRFSTTNPEVDGKVPLADELTQVKNLIQLNAHRFNEEMSLQTDIAQASSDLRILPLLLLSLTENIFKHGDLTDEHHPGQLTISIDHRRLLFISKNVKKDLEGIKGNTHLGIEQARIRLAHYYPGRHQLIINETENLFTLRLEIDL